MRIVMITTAGTSALTNQLKLKEESDRVNKLSNRRESELSPADRAFIDNVALQAREALNSASNEEAKRLSAELNAIFSYEDELRKQGRHPGRLSHYLLATDTYAGHLAGTLIQDRLRTEAEMADLWRIEDLRTGDLDEFRCALAEAVDKLLGLIEGHQKSKAHVVFNLTAGFKGISAFCQTVAALAQCESIYIFQGGKLMTIPRMPITFRPRDVIEPHWALYRQLARGDEFSQEQAEAAGIPDALLLSLGGGVRLSEWGKLLWRSAWKELARERLLEPEHPRIEFGQAFERTLQPYRHRLEDINETILALGDWLDNRATGRLQQHNVTKLKGDPRPPSTHEIYVWSDQEAGRIFFHLKGGSVVIDNIGDHL